jgi:GDP-L-fucose synthase
VIIDAAAKWEGYCNNDFPYQFIMENMQIQNNRYRITIRCGEFIFWKFLHLSKIAPQPLKEEYLLTDTLEPTNEWYAIAKITGESCQAIRNQFNKDYVSLMPTIFMELMIILI